MNREDVDFLTIDGKVDEADNTTHDLTASPRYADRDNASTDAHGVPLPLSDPDSLTLVANLRQTLTTRLIRIAHGTVNRLIKEDAGTLILPATTTTAAAPITSMVRWSPPVRRRWAP